MWRCARGCISALARSRRGGEDEARARMSVVQDLADELVDGHGLGIVLRCFEHQHGEVLVAELGSVTARRLARCAT